MQDVVADFAGLILPDARLVRRVQSLVQSAWKAPSQSFPQMLQDQANLEGAYRLLNNERVSFAMLQKPHALQSAQRAMQEGEVVVVHDSSDIETPYLDESEASYLAKGAIGYRAHISLAISVQPNRAPRPFGVLAAQADFQTKAPKWGRKKKKKSKSGAATARSRTKAFLRWHRGIEASAAALEGCSSVIHVADREADSYPLFCLVEQLGQGCVFRIRNDRRARLADDEVDDDWSLLSEIASGMQGSFELTVPLSKRGHKGAPARLKTHPPREARAALLQYSATRVELKRPHYQPASLPQSLSLWMVRVWEPSPPKGEKPVEWLLLTTESCETAAEIGRVVELYRARWMIEDFFKALKTGCALEQRQFETRHALLNVLALFLPIAVHLLWLRTCARDAPMAPATDVLTPTQLTVLRHLSHRKFPENPTVFDALWSLAGLGGHIKSNGWPGWQVLGRAFVKLVEATVTWELAARVGGSKM